MEIVYYAIPFFFLTLVGEYFAIRKRVGTNGSREELDELRVQFGSQSERARRDGPKEYSSISRPGPRTKAALGPKGDTNGLKGHEMRDTAASLTMGIGSLFTSAAALIPEIAAYTFLYEFRLFDLPNVWWIWPLLILAEDHSYYWFHRMHHQSRVLWAAHITHHSSEHYNLSTALRQSWTTQFTGIPFWLPLPLLGFAPEQILVAKSISLLYQYWIHTESIRSLGPLEWIFNTPSHHRVHHATNPLYLDRNHGGIFIIWDRLYGTFEPEVERPRYGIITPLKSFNPIRIAFHEWVALFRDVRQAESLGGALKLIFGLPGYREDGTGITSEDLRRMELERRTQKSANEPSTEPPIEPPMEEPARA